MEEVVKKYAGKGFNLTPQRLSILKFLDGNKDHPSAEAIFGAVQKEHPAISLATVYNTLEMLKEKGEVLEVTIDSDKKHYDSDTSPHHHVICRECGKIADIHVDYSKDIELPTGLYADFTVEHVDLHFYGICVDCEKTEKTVQ